MSKYALIMQPEKIIEYTNKTIVSINIEECKLVGNSIDSEKISSSFGSFESLFSFPNG